MYAQTTTINQVNDDYYQRKYIIYEILKCCKNRDFSALGKKNDNIRALDIRCIFDFERALKLINWKNNKQKLYVGCARLKSIPDFTFNPKERTKETQPWYTNQYAREIINYDLFFDFDKEKDTSWEELTKEVKEFKEYLDEYNISYYMLFSGSKGFQIVVDGEYLDISKVEDGNVHPHKEIIERIKEQLGLKFLDLSNNGVISKLRKLPYSICEENIALPLSNEQFENFNINNMKIESILKNVPLIRRGVLERNLMLELNEKKENLNNFLEIFNFKNGS